MNTRRTVTALEEGMKLKPKKTNGNPYGNEEFWTVGLIFEDRINLRGKTSTAQMHPDLVSYFFQVPNKKKLVTR